MRRRWFSPLTEVRVLLRRLALARSDRARWGAATSLQDLGDLTAAWLSGEITAQAGDDDHVDGGEDGTTGFMRTLIALNTAGVVTRASQSGYAGDGMRQMAVVTGYASPNTTALLRARLRDTGYQVHAHPVRAPFTRGGTWFAGGLSAAEVAIDLAGAGRDAITAACAAQQVTIWDPQAGPTQMWAALQSAVVDPPGRGDVGAQLTELIHLLNGLSGFDSRRKPSGDRPVSLVSDAGVSADGAR